MVCCDTDTAIAVDCTQRVNMFTLSIQYILEPCAVLLFKINVGIITYRLLVYLVL